MKTRHLLPLLLSVLLQGASPYQCGPLIERYLSKIESIAPYSGLDKVDCIYVINLKERPERWEHAKKTYDSYQLHPTRINACNGWSLSQEEKRALLDPRVFTSSVLELIGGEVGCLLSHISIYQDALERNLSTIWICEDDIKLNNKVYDLPSIIEELFALDPEWDILYTDYTRFGAAHQKPRPEQKPFVPLDIAVSERIARTHGRYGTHSMVLSRKGFEKLLSYFYERCFWSPIDLDLHYAELKEYSVIRSITQVASFPSDTQPWSSLKKEK